MSVMTAAFYEGPRKLNLRRIVAPVVSSSDDVVIRVLICGSCGTDLGIIKGYIPEVIPPVVLGHEVIGEILEAGNSVTNYRVGDIVMVDPHIPCGKCDPCHAGNYSKCISPLSLGCNYPGGFAEFCLVPRQSLYKIPETMPLDQMIFAEPIACVLNSFQHLHVRNIQTALIIGAGTIGQLFIEFLRKRGVKNIIVSELVNERCRQALTHGATLAINPKIYNLEKAIAEFTNGVGVDLAVDTAGDHMGKLVSVVAQRGQIVLFGLHNPSRIRVDEYQIIAKELQISSSLSASTFMPAAIELLSNRSVCVDFIKGTNIHLNEIVEGFESLIRRSTMKLFVRPS